MSPRIEIFIVLLLLIVAMTVSVTSIRTFNETIDEIPHIAAGYSYLHMGDFRLNLEHPPLIKEIAALPLLLMRVGFDKTSNSWKLGLDWEVGEEFMYFWNHPERIVFQSRLPMIGLYLALGLLVWWGARSLFGPFAAILALLFALFTPDLLAHGSLVTTDFGMTLFGFATLWFFYRSLVAGGKKTYFFFSLSCGALATTKYTAPIIFLILLLLTAAYLLYGSRMRDLNPQTTVKMRLFRVLQLALWAVAATLVIIWAVYGFRYAISPEAVILTSWNDYDQRELLTRVVLLFRDFRLFPEAYLAGVLECFKSLADRPTYIFGRVLQGGHWYYFPVTFLLKTPVPLLLLLAFGAFRRGRDEWLSMANLTLLLPPAIYLLIAMQMDVNIGNRHILPIYPFLIVWAAEAGRLFSPGINGKNIALVVLTAWFIIGTVRIYPDFLAYFNEIAGGPTGGSRYLADSNIDWGQDLKRLATYRENAKEEQLFLCYFGPTATQEYYLPGVPRLPCLNMETPPFPSLPKGGLVAISLNFLNGLYLTNNRNALPFLEQLRSLKPIDSVGQSIYIYRMP